MPITIESSSIGIIQALKIKNPTLVLDFCLLTIYSLAEPI